MAKKTINLYVAVKIIQHMPFKTGDKTFTLALFDKRINLLGAFLVFKTKKDAQKYAGKKGKVVTVPVTLSK